jgi:hypothetical protein
MHDNDKALEADPAWWPLVKALDYLEDRGYVERGPRDADGNRSIAITPRGVEFARDEGFID